MSAQKTYKRETAIALLVFSGALIAFSAYQITYNPDAGRDHLADLASGVFWAAITFAAAAFGLDWGAKQSPWAGGKE